MVQEIYVSIDECEGRAVLFEDGRLMETLIARNDSQVGNIYKGRVENVIAGMNAAFVDIGMERNGFLCADDAASHLQDLDNPPNVTGKRRIVDIVKKGQDALVQVVKEVIGKKGARLTTNISLSGRFFVLLPTIPACHIGVSRKITSSEERERLHGIAQDISAGRCGTIVRTAAENCNIQELQRDWEELWIRWETIKRASKVMPVPSLLYSEVSLVDKVVRDMLTTSCERIIIDNREAYERLIELLNIVSPDKKDKVSLYRESLPLFTKYEIDSAIEKALHRKVHLKSGGNLVIERTEALWVIDVNTAQNVDKNAILATNLEAGREICRQMRLRDMSGIIIVDFINMESSSDQESLLVSLNEELKRDRVRTKLVGMTELGLVQITRKRSGKDLERIMREPCSECYGSGRVLSAQATALKARRELLRCQGELYHDAYWVKLSPRVAWKFVGEKGRLVEELSKNIKCSLRVFVDEKIHQGQFIIESAKLEELWEPLELGQQVEMNLYPHYGDNSDSCLAVYKGHLVEVSNGANCMERSAIVRITEPGKYISRGKALK